MKPITALLSVLAIPSCFAQQAISVRSGLIHHVEGQVTLAGKPLRQEVGKFANAQEGMVLNTANGRAEVLLTPGVFLRLGDRSSLKMLSTSLSDTQVEISGGAALVEVVEMAKENRVVIRVAGVQSRLDRPGIYMFDADSNRVRAYDGKLTVVAANGETLVLGKGRQVALGSKLVATRFKSKDPSELYEWSMNRASMVAQANVSAASTFRKTGYAFSHGGWYWYPGMGLLTFMPGSGALRSGFGWFYYCPSTVWQYYAPRQDQSTYAGTDAYRGGADRPSWSGNSGGYGANSSAGVSAVSSAGMDGGGRAAAAAPAAAAAVDSPGGGRSR